MENFDLIYYIICVLSNIKSISVILAVVSIIILIVRLIENNSTDIIIDSFIKKIIFIIITTINLSIFIPSKYEMNIMYSDYKLKELKLDMKEILSSNNKSIQKIYNIENRITNLNWSD